MGRPAFTPVVDGQEYSVLVTWENGGQSRIQHFRAIQDAQGWIDRESSNWIRTREERSHALSEGSKNAEVVGFRTRVLKVPT
jgi:hypothetical protein